MSIAEVMRLHGRMRPRKIAIVDGDRRIAYGELDRKLDGFCHAMRGAGLRRGHFVGVALSDTAEHLMTLLGLSRLGAVIVPMDHRWSNAEVASVAASFSAKVVVVDSGRADCPQHWKRAAPSWFDESGSAYLDPEIGPESPLLLSLSSGTTGTPKGPCVTHQRFENRFMAYWINLGFNALDRFVCATPLYFGGGRGFSWANLFCGATVHVFAPPFGPLDLVDYVRRNRATSMFLVPTLIRRLLEAGAAGPAFPDFRCLISSGSALYEYERRAVRERLTPNLYEMYSSSEGGAISVLAPSDMDTHGDTVGRPCFRVNVEIVDSDEKPLGRGMIGALRYRSPAVPDNYVGGDADEGGFRDGWFYPGDVAEQDEEGFIRLRGRWKDVIIRGGVNIYPADIEQTLLRHPSVSDVAVVGMPAATLGEEVAAFVVVDKATSTEMLTRFCQDALAPYKVPRLFVMLDELPRNNGGKVVKAELRETLAKLQPAETAR